MMSRAYCTGLMPRSLSRVLQPGLAADAEPVGDVVDLLIDLGRRDLLLPGLERLLDQGAVDQGVEDLLPLAGHALVGELLAGDDLVVDDRDRVGGIDGDGRQLGPRGR